MWLVAQKAIVELKFLSYFLAFNVCLIKIRSKHISNTLLSLLRIFMRQTLVNMKNSHMFEITFVLFQEPTQPFKF